MKDSTRAAIMAELKSANVIADAAQAANRNFTDDERTKVNAHLKMAKTLKERDADAANFAGQLKNLSDTIGLDGPADGTGGFRAGYGGGAGGGFKAAASPWAATVAERLTKTAAQFGVKALTTGGIDVPAVIEPTVELPSRPTRLLDLVPTKGLTGNEYSYPKQTARINNASTVADGAEKLVSVYTFEEVIDRARVIAHLSEPIPLRYFEDHSDLQGILDGQMRLDLLLKVEALIATGTGVGEDWTGILATSGTLAQPWVTDIVTTLRKARTALDVLGEEPTAFVFHPNDIERIDLLTDDNSRYYTTELERLLGNLPRISSSAVTEGVALLGDFRQSRLFVRHDARLDVDRSGELFDRNQAKLRMEMRAGFGVLRPQAFVEIDLTA